MQLPYFVKLKICENVWSVAKSRPSRFRSDKQLYTLLATSATGKDVTSQHVIGHLDWSHGGIDLRLHRVGSRCCDVFGSTTLVGPNATKVGLEEKQ